MSERVALLAIDAGNTRVKAALFADGEMDERFDLPSGNVEAMVAAMRERERPAAVIVASVVRNAVETIAEAVRAAWETDTIAAGPDLPIGVRVAVPKPGAVGIDRLLMAGEGYAIAEGACVVVGAGTAITVDVVTADGTYVGGTISAGLRTSLWALAERTSLLPEVDPDGPVPDLPDATETGIRSGVILGAAGSVDRITRTLARSASLDTFTLILSGGDADRIGPFLETPHTVVEDLVLRGLASTYRRLSETA